MTTGSDYLRQMMKERLAEHHHMAARFAAELEFAEGLARLRPDQAAGWPALIAEAARLVTGTVISQDLARLEAAVREAEAVLAPIGKVAKQYTLHCVGHAHIDMNWMWSWPETVAVTNDTFLTMLKLMEEFPDFCFTQSQASVYALMLEHNPALLKAIARRIRQGRWEVAASHWVEGDKNIAGGEALARHLLYTRRFMKETFGLAPEDVAIDWSPDTFGHAHTIPTIDSRGGVRRYYMCRGGAFEKPPVFWWQGPDGSRILVNLETTWYNDHIGTHNALACLAFCEKTGLVDWMNVYGVGDHGGGPTRRDILRAHDMNSWPIYPNFRLATTRDFYSLLEKCGEKWPVLDRELNFEFTGCYTSQAFIKHATRYGENYCLEAEAAAAVARRAVGSPYPAEGLRQAWVNTLFGHFHDILPGSGIRATRDYQLGLFQKTAAATNIIKTQALRAIAAEVNTAFAPAAPRIESDVESIALGGGAGRGTMTGGMTTAAHVTKGPRALLVFNPTAWPRREIVSATLWDVESGRPGDAPKSFVVHTPDGRTLPAQRLTAGDYWGHRFVDVAVPAQAGALGYATYIIYEGDAPPPEGAVMCGAGFRGGERQPEGSLTLENEFLAVAFDRETGGIVRLVDKIGGVDLASPAAPTAMPEYVLERPRPMSAWLLADPKERRCPLALDSLGPDLCGPLVASMVAKLKLGDSAVTVTYTLKAGQPWLEITVQARWVERGGPETGTPSLVMKFPLALEQAAARYEIPFGSIRRDLSSGEEVPALRWADVIGKPAGVKTALAGAAAGCALLNDSKYGHSLTGSTLRLTLIRSTYEPDPLPEIGDHTIRMCLLPHGRQPAVADLVRLGAGFNHPLLVVAVDTHGGRLPPEAATIAAQSAANVIISSVKKAEDGEALIFHLYETAGQQTKARITLNPHVAGRPIKADEVDLLERPLKKSTAKATKDGFSVTVPAHGIAAVKVAFAKN
ncbi:MAG: glycosyl hydrolase-related protein [Planctomycetota bacterium]|nr:glycosyl hydrolase-related protein [Planctomycetota bacterium]